VISASEAEGLGPVIKAGNPKIDGRLECWDVYNEIIRALGSREDDCQPRLIPDDDWTNLSFLSEEEPGKWKEEAQRVAFGW
jgi:hypothetical protein